MPLRCLTMLALLSAAAAHAACDPGIAGPTMNWAGFVCELRVETDDFTHPEVQACLHDLVAEDKIRSEPAEMCELNARYKAEICKAWVADGVEKSQAVCMRSTTTIPFDVKNGMGR